MLLYTINFVRWFKKNLPKIKQWIKTLEASKKLLAAAQKAQPVFVPLTEEETNQLKQLVKNSEARAKMWQKKYFDAINSRRVLP